MSKLSHAHNASVSLLALGLALATAGCQKTAPEPETSPQTTTTAETAAPAATPAAAASATPPTGDSALSSSMSTAAPEAATPPPAPTMTVASVPVSPDDPLHGKFTLEDATKGLAGTGALYAEIQTELGKLECELYDDKAPITVANFIGLARGLRPFKQKDGSWAKKPGYEGTTFHRVIKGFMVQGGDPLGTGAGEPGYVIPDEVWAGAHHNERGQICMANRGKNTNGMQFFIMDGNATYLDGGYTIFGKCGPEDVITKLAGVEVQGDRSVKPTKINKVIIKRKPKKADKADKPDVKAASGTPAAAPGSPAPGAAPGVPAAPPAAH